MSFLKIEQETVINFNAAEDMAELYTADPVMIRKMDKLVKNNPEQFRGEVHSRYKGKVYGMNYIFPKRFVSIRSKDKEMSMTEEQRRAAAERIKQMRENH